jgi:predicted lactoylglutathione lyase
MLSLYKGPNLILRSTLSETVNSDSLPPFIFKSKRTIEGLKEHLSAAGAKIQGVEDEGFAYFLSFEDPFSHSWLVMCEK